VLLRGIGLLLLGAALSVPAQAGQVVTGATITHPVGAFVRYDLSRDLGSGFSAGLYDEFLFYSNGVGLTLAWRADPAWIRFTLDLGVEPGWFMQLAPNAPYRENGERQFGLRTLVRPRIHLNIRNDRWWLYGRTTGLYRGRDFREADSFKGIAIKNEMSIDQAYALMRRIGGADPVAVWFYVEHTVGYLRGFGVRPNRFSAGFVSEDWPRTGVGLNLDLYYSIAAPPIEGPGVVANWFIAW
jgi:hypothetical protein